MTIRDTMEHPNFRRIKDSLEAKALKRETTVIGIVMGIYVLLIAVAMMPLISSRDPVPRNPGAAVVSLSWLAILLMVGIGYYVYRWTDLFRHIDRYAFSQVKLDKPCMGYKGAMGFYVEVMDRKGNHRSKETRKIFNKTYPSFEEYHNQTVTIAYNDETDTVVVIG